MPLADKFRPKNLDEVVGQRHIIGDGKILNNMVEKNYLPNLIFFGAPGIGKTTVAEILASNTEKKFFKINASNSSIEDIKSVIREVGKIDSKNGILLYIDEVQSFNKKQQQLILEFIETGEITLIASTTENPYHYVYKAILSRSVIIEFKPVDSSDIVSGLKNIIKRYNNQAYSKVIYEKEALIKIANSSNGDVRSSINILEMAINNSVLDENMCLKIDKEVLKKLEASTAYNFDVGGDIHYSLLSAFQKSIRGSDADASIYYLARLIKGGDLISICRRLLVIASEDIGLAYPNAASIVKSLVDSAFMLGLPEARIPLSQAVILLSTSPKSNSVIMAIDKALNDIESENQGDIPDYLKDAHYSGAEKLNHGVGYKYPHDYENHYVNQDYLPENLRGRTYYDPQNNKFENSIREFMEKLQG